MWRQFSSCIPNYDWLPSCRRMPAKGKNATGKGKASAKAKAAALSSKSRSAEEAVTRILRKEFKGWSSTDLSTKVSGRTAMEQIRQSIEEARATRTRVQPLKCKSGCGSRCRSDTDLDADPLGDHMNLSPIL